MWVSARDSCYRTTIMLDLPVIVARIHRTTDKNIRNISPSMCERFANIFVTYSVRALAWVSCCRSKLLRASVAIAPLRGSFPPHFVRQDKKTYVNASFLSWQKIVDVFQEKIISQIYTLSNVVSMRKILTMISVLLQEKLLPYICQADTEFV